MYINYGKLLCFADDLKLFMRINSLDDCHKFRSDLNKFFEWSQMLDLTLNIDKCYVMSFLKKHSIILRGPMNYLTQKFYVLIL